MSNWMGKKPENGSEETPEQKPTSPDAESGADLEKKNNTRYVIFLFHNLQRHCSLPDITREASLSASPLTWTCILLNFVRFDFVKHSYCYAYCHYSPWNCACALAKCVVNLTTSFAIVIAVSNCTPDAKSILSPHNSFWWTAFFVELNGYHFGEFSFWY